MSVSTATYWQRGESLDYVNSGSEAIKASTIIVFGGRVGVAGTTIPVGELGSIAVTGVFEMPKANNEAIEMGKTVYYNGSAITGTATGNTLAGYAAQAAVATDTTVLVKLTG